MLQEMWNSFYDQKTTESIKHWALNFFVAGGISIVASFFYDDFELSLLVFIVSVGIVEALAGDGDKNQRRYKDRLSFIFGTSVTAAIIFYTYTDSILNGIVGFFAVFVAFATSYLKQELIEDEIEARANKKKSSDKNSNQ